MAHANSLKLPFALVVQKEFGYLGRVLSRKCLVERIAAQLLASVGVGQCDSGIFHVAKGLIAMNSGHKYNLLYLGVHLVQADVYGLAVAAAVTSSIEPSTEPSADMGRTVAI